MRNRFRQLARPHKAAGGRVEKAVTNSNNSRAQGRPHKEVLRKPKATRWKRSSEAAQQQQQQGAGQTAQGGTPQAKADKVVTNSNNNNNNSSSSSNNNNNN
jgi:hypothetical protein